MVVYVTTLGILRQRAFRAILKLCSPTAYTTLYAELIAFVKWERS